MSSSMSSAEVLLELAGRQLGNVVLDASESTAETTICEVVDATTSRGLYVIVRTTVGADLRIGLHNLARVTAGESRYPVPLDDLLGEVELQLELAAVNEEEPPRIARLRFLVEGTTATREAYETILADLERLQPRLLQEVGGAITLQREQQLRSVDPDHEVRILQDWSQRLHRALLRIEERPFDSIAAKATYRAWRPGDELADDIQDVVLAEGTVFRAQQIVAIGRVRVRELERSLDVPEHRHLALGVRLLRVRARALERWCEGVLDAYESDRQRWGGGPESVDEQRNGSRRRQLRMHVRTTRQVDQALGELARRSQILMHVPPTVGTLRPTPLWLARREYRDAYDVLRELAWHGGSILVGDEFRVRLRGLDQLFEYWCFTRTLLAVAARLGGSVDGSLFRLVDDVYRPDLRPGLVVRFRGSDGAEVAVGYEPGFPVREPRRVDALLPGPYRSMLGTGELRPDIVVRLDRPGGAPRLLVLDAKNTERFDRDQLFKVSDYRSRIVNPATGHQPARWMTCLHRDVARTLVENVPGLLDGKRGDWENFYIAGLCVLPDQGERLQQLIARFLETP